MKFVDSEDVHGHNKKVVCYWGTWANYRPDGGKFTPDQVDPNLCTHLVYSFAGLDLVNSAIKSLDTWMDLEENYGLGGFTKATNLKVKYPHLKVNLAIGGWNEGSKKYSNLAADPKKRKTFVNSATSFILEHKFDGLDLDWEYPTKRGGVLEDKENFIYLIRDLQAVFSKHNLLLTAAIGADPGTIDTAYNIEEMYKYLDFVHVMCYDYHGKWDKKTGHNAPLYPGESQKSLNLEYTIAYLLEKGADPRKTVMGVPLYGRSFLLVDRNNNGVSARTKDKAFQGPYTREDGFLGYNEVCEEILDQKQPWTRMWDKEQGVPYLFRGEQWLSYDDETSISLKSKFALEKGLAGVMVWSIDTDDFSGSCQGPKFPILKAINKALAEGEEGFRNDAIRRTAGILLEASLCVAIQILLAVVDNYLF